MLRFLRLEMMKNRPVMHFQVLYVLFGGEFSIEGQNIKDMLAIFAVSQRAGCF